MARRTLLSDYALANPLYIGGTLTFYTIDAAGVKTATLATLYANETGTTPSDQLSNPQVLDSDGKLLQPTYFEDGMIGEVTGAAVASHDTGIIYPVGNYRGAWATATLYYPGDIVLAGAAADSTNDLYIIEGRHTSGVFATDLGNLLLAQLLDVSLLSALTTTPVITGGDALKWIRVNAGATAYELVTIATLVANILTSEPEFHRLNVADTKKKALGETKVALTDAATVAVDLSLAQCYNLTMAGNRTLGFPTNIEGNGGEYYIDVTIDATGGLTLAFAAGYNVVSGALDSSANAVNRLWLVVRTAAIIDVYIDNLA